MRTVFQVFAFVSFTLFAVLSAGIMATTFTARVAMASGTGTGSKGSRGGSCVNCCTCNNKGNTCTAASSPIGRGCPRKPACVCVCVCKNLGGNKGFLCR